MASVDSDNRVTSARYCGGPAAGIFGWSHGRDSAAALGAAWPQLRDRALVATYRGRTAIALACQALGLGPGDEVLMPAYNCGTEVDAIRAAGSQVVAYRIDRSCQPDFADLARRATPRTRAVYAIHYFGWPQPLAQLRTWCDERRIFLIEDCALALFSEGPHHNIGRVGDAAVYSFPKTLGFRHGGLLALRAGLEPAFPALAPALARTLQGELKQSAKSRILRTASALGAYGLLLRWKGRRSLGISGSSHPPMPESYVFDPAVDANRSAHPRAVSVALRQPREKIIERRCEHYRFLAAALRGIQGITVLFPELPEGVCPLSVPVAVPRRNECVAALLTRGIAALPWWAGYHEGLIDWDQFPDASWLKNHVLTLPVTPDFGEKDLQHIITNFGQILGSQTSSNLELS